jgi:hypothetical protein
MQDEWNPTTDELRAWAYGQDPDFEPDPDFDLSVARLEHAELLMEGAADPACGQRDFFVRVLYLLVGDAVRSEGEEHDLGVLSQLVDDAAESADERLQLWAERARELLEHPERFDYDDWCDGGLARR